MFHQIHILNIVLSYTTKHITTKKKVNFYENISNTLQNNGPAEGVLELI